MNILEYENYQEKKAHGDLSFPYITYLCSIPLDFSSVPVHWPLSFFTTLPTSTLQNESEKLQPSRFWASIQEKPALMFSAKI